MTVRGDIEAEILGRMERRLDALAFTACFGAPWLPVAECLTRDASKHLRASSGEAIAELRRFSDRMKTLQREHEERRRAALEQMNAAERFVEMAARPGAVVYAHPDDVERVKELLDNSLGRLGLRATVQSQPYLNAGKPIVVDHKEVQRRSGFIR